MKIVLDGSQWTGKTWYAYGTSMTEFGTGKYAAYLAEFSGMRLVNFGSGGRGVTENIGGYSSKAEIRHRAMDLTDGKLEADLITLEVGPNDSGAPLGDIYEENETTFCGCLNQTIRFLQFNTKAQIVVMSMIGTRYAPGDPSQIHAPGSRIQAKDGTSYTWYEMAGRIRDVCGVNSVYYIPVAESCGLGLSRIGMDKTYVLDQIHLSELGGYNVAQFIWSKLKNIPLWYSEMPSDVRGCP